VTKISFILVLLAMGFVTASFSVRIAYAWTPVEGHITEDTTWTIDKSPYRAINDVTVDPAVHLTIMPGVQVQFADSYSLIVEGSLDAVGTESNQIRFTSSRTSPSSGVWKGIAFSGSQVSLDSLVMRYVVVEYAATGIDLNGNGTMEIQFSKIRNNTVGVCLNQGGVLINGNSFDSNRFGVKLIAGSDVTVSANSFVHSYQGIITQSPGDYRPASFDILNIANNEISSSEEEGVQFSITSMEIKVGFSIQQNRIYSNGGTGISLRISQHPSSVPYSIRDNQFWSNWEGIRATIDGDVDIVNNSLSRSAGYDGWYGLFIYCGGGTNLTIANNRIDSNHGDGLGISARTQGDISISNNSMASNEGDGVALFGGGTVRINITYNSISGNGVGIRIENSFDSHVHLNDIIGNTQGMIVAGASVDAENNYWGHVSGPFHPSVNPEGQGNSVNGNGVDLDFIPFLGQSINPIVPEFQSFLAPMLFMMATLPALAVRVKKRARSN
jgi:hypothetical protein